MNILLVSGSRFKSPIRHIDQHLPRYLAKYAHVVFFEFPQFKKLFQVFTGKLPITERINEHLTVFHSIGLLPWGRYIPIFNKFNHIFNSLLLRQTVGIQYDIIITFTPEYALIDHYVKSGKVIYHVLDNYSSLPWWGSKKSGRRQLRNLESRTLKLADLVIVVSPYLFDSYKNRHRNIRLFPTPAFLKHYRTNNIRKTPYDMKKIPRPIIGFSGSAPFAGKIDFALIAKLVQHYQNYSFVFTGVYENKLIKGLLRFRNFHMLGYKTLEALPSYISSFDVCLVPYLTNSYGKSAYPVKIMEYLCLGNPVVTTALPSVEFLAGKNLIYWSASQDEFIRNIDRAMKEGMGNKKLINARIKEGRRNDWAVRIREYMKIIK